jgi:uncharacterized protein YdeI (BOF family)
MPQLGNIFSINISGYINYISLSLATLIQFWFGSRFYRELFKALKDKKLKIEILIVPITTILFLYSSLITIIPEYFSISWTYFDTIAITNTLMLIGNLYKIKSNNISFNDNKKEPTNTSGFFQTKESTKEIEKVMELIQDENSIIQRAIDNYLVKDKKIDENECSFNTHNGSLHIDIKIHNNNLKEALKEFKESEDWKKSIIRNNEIFYGIIEDYIVDLEEDMSSASDLLSGLDFKKTLKEIEIGNEILNNIRKGSFK